MARLYRSDLESGVEVDSLTITTQPTTTSYMQGDTFDPTGMVVVPSASGMTGSNVVQYCTFSPSVLVTPGTQTITVSYMGVSATTTVTVSEVSISITTPPTQTEFEKGGTLDLTGIVVTAMDGQRTKVVTSQCTFDPANGSILTKAGTIPLTATYYGHTASMNITVTGLIGISVTTPPTKVLYAENDTLDLTGIVVTADYGSYTTDVTSLCTFSPADGATLTASMTEVTATFSDETATTPLMVIASTLDECSWATIQAIGAAGTGSQYWRIGDYKTITMSGNIGYDGYINSDNVRVFIVHFNYRNQNGVYFGALRAYNPIADVWNDVAICGSVSFNQDKTDGTKYININHSGNVYFGGWKGCDWRYDILGSTDVKPSGYPGKVASGRVGYDATATCATNPVPNTLMSCLPAELRAVMAPITIYTDNSPTAAHTAQDTVTASIDYLPIYSEYEVLGSNSGANIYEPSYQTRISYFSSGVVAIYNYDNVINGRSSGIARFTRSAGKGGNNVIIGFNSGGARVTYSLSRTTGIYAWFRVA